MMSEFFNFLKPWFKKKKNMQIEKIQTFNPESQIEMETSTSFSL